MLTEARFENIEFICSFGDAAGAFNDQLMVITSKRMGG